MRRDEHTSEGMLGDSHRAGRSLDFFGMTEALNKNKVVNGLKAETW